MLPTQSFIHHRRCIKFFSQYFSSPCQYHSPSAPYSFIYLPPTLYKLFLPVLQISLGNIIPPMLHTHSFIYHPRCIKFFSQYFSFSCQYHSPNAPYPFIHLPPTLYNVFSQYFSFPCQYHSTDAPCPFIHLPPTLYNVFLPVLQFLLSVSFSQCSIPIHSSTANAV